VQSRELLLFRALVFTFLITLRGVILIIATCIVTAACFLAFSASAVFFVKDAGLGTPSKLPHVPSSSSSSSTYSSSDSRSCARDPRHQACQLH
jgi:hypothetical protein